MSDNFIEQAKEILINKSCLCFEGGGVLGIGHIGALSRLKELGGLKNISHVVGTSVGSFLAAGLACGASYEYISKIFLGLDLEKFKDQSNCFLVDIIRLFKNFGPNRGIEIKKLASQIMSDLTGDPDISFKQAFDKFGIRLTITYLSVNYERTMYADYKTQPNLMIREAILRSSTIPIFYEAVKNDRLNKGKEVIVDGGVLDNYPIHVLFSQGCNKRKVLGFKLCSSKEKNQYKEDQGEKIEYKDLGEPTKFMDYVTRLVGILHNQALRYHVKEDDWKLTVKINHGELQTTDFKITEEQKQWLFNEGRKGVDKHIQEVAKLLENNEYFDC
jgi:NTE family protein